MANNRLPFGLCKKYHIDLPDDATPHDAWEALKSNGIIYFEQEESTILNPARLLSGVSFEEPEHITDKPTIPLPKMEYWRVCSAISRKIAGLNLNEKIITIRHGNYVYIAEVHGFDSYRIIGKSRLK